MRAALHHLLTFVVYNVLGALAGWGLALLDTRWKRRARSRAADQGESSNAAPRVTWLRRSEPRTASGTDGRPAVP